MSTTKKELKSNKTYGDHLMDLSKESLVEMILRLQKKAEKYDEIRRALDLDLENHEGKDRRSEEV